MKQDAWIDLAKATCADAGVDCHAVETIATWDEYACANAIFRINDDHYLKLFGPSAERQFFVERAVLTTLAPVAPIPAPRILAEGQPTDRPPYLLLSAIEGTTAEIAWDALSRENQLALARDLGRVTAAIHQLPTQALAAVEQQVAGWPEHAAKKQARHLAIIHSTESVSPDQRARVAHFLQHEAPALLTKPRKLIHCELAHNHIYLAEAADAWRLSGIIDWADAMLGPSEWDVAFLWLWMLNRDEEAMRVCLDALLANNPPERFARRCLAAILHTHSMPALWAEFTARGLASGDIVKAMTAYLFPPTVFGSPE